jgi:hypothetical protein
LRVGLVLLVQREVLDIKGIVAFVGHEEYKVAVDLLGQPVHRDLPVLRGILVYRDLPVMKQH